MRKFLSKLLFGIVIILSLNACGFDFSDYLHDNFIYHGNDPELHSIALESIIGSESYGSNEVLRIEEDTYGRVLFGITAHYLYWTSDQTGIIAVVIAQKADSDFAYYYDSSNAIAIYVDWLNEKLTLNLLESYFDEEEIEELKVKNDWNKPINDKLLFRTEVTRKKTCDVLARELRPYENLLEGDPEYALIQCYGEDRNGYILVSVETLLTESYGGPSAIYLLIVDQSHKLVSPNAVMRITDILDMEAIKRFKQENGWSFEKQYD